MVEVKTLKRKYKILIREIETIKKLNRNVRTEIYNI